MLVGMSSLDVAVSIALGVGLAAATRFRVFLPLLVASVAAYTGHLQLNDSFGWLGSLAAVTMLAVAALVEVLAYYWLPLGLPRRAMCANILRYRPYLATRRAPCQSQLLSDST